MTKLSFINNNPDNLANHYVDAAIGAGNRPMTSSQA